MGVGGTELTQLRVTGWADRRVPLDASLAKLIRQRTRTAEICAWTD